MEIVMSKINAAMGVEEQTDPEAEAPQTPKEIERYLTYTYRDIREITGQRSLTYLRKNQNLDHKFNQGFKHAMIASEEVYYVGLRGGEPHVRNVNTLDVSFIMDPDSDFIEDGIAAVEERWLTVPTILDQFHDLLSPKEIAALEADGGRKGAGAEGGDLNYPHSEFRIQRSEEYDSSKDSRRTKGEDGTIKVIHCEWKSMKKVGFIAYTDESGEAIEDIVDEEFVVPEGASKKKDKNGKTVYQFEMSFFYYKLQCMTNSHWTG